MRILVAAPLLSLALWWALRRVSPATSLRPFLAGAAALLLLPFAPKMHTANPMGTAKFVFAFAAAVGVLVWLLEALRPTVSWRVALVFLLLTSAILSVQPPGESDEADYLLLAESLRTDGDMILNDEFRSDAQVRILGWEPPLFGDELPKFRADPDLPPRPSFRAPLGGALFIPGLCLQDLVRGVFGSGAPAWLCLYLLPTILLGLAVRSMVAAAPEDVTKAGLLGILLAPPFFYYASQAQPEALIVLLVALAVEGLIRDRPRSAALAIALLPLAHYRMGVLSLLLAALLFWRGSRILATVGLAIGGAIWFWTAVVLAGGVSPALARLSGGLEFGAPIWGVQNLPAGLYALVASPKVGIVAWCPAVFLVAWGWRERTTHAPLLAALGYLLFMAGYRSAGDSFPYARYMVPAIPLLAPAILVGARRAPRVASLLAGWSAVLYLLVTTLPQLWRWMVC